MQQHDLTNIPQIKVSFSHNIPFEARPHISNSEDAIKVFLAHWDKNLMNVQKEMYILYLDQHHRAIGVYHHSKGGIQDCLGELQQVFAVGLQANAAYFAVAINDTAGNHEPSEAEIDAAKHIQQTARAIGLQLHDYFVITSEKFVSFKDNFLLLPDFAF